MNDMTRRAGGWNTMAQSSCPGCGPQNTVAYSDPEGGQAAFLAPSVRANMRLPRRVAPNNNMPQQNAPLWEQGETTSNYADLGLAPDGGAYPEAGAMSPQMSMASQSMASQSMPAQSMPAQAMPSQQPLPGQNAANTPIFSLIQQQGGDVSPIELPGLTAINLMNQTTAVSDQNLQYLNGFLLTQIGRNVTVTFLIGSNYQEVRSGTLVGVGANYILINEFGTRDVLACDFYSIKFIKFYY